MRKEEYLEKLKNLLHAALEKEDAENAYSYYLDLFEEEEPDIIMMRIGSPEEVVASFLDSDKEFRLLPVPHNVKDGFSRLFNMIRSGGWRALVSGAYLALLLLLILALAISIASHFIFLVVDISLGGIAIGYVFFDLAAISILVLAIMLSLRHLPYLLPALLERRSR